MEIKDLLKHGDFSGLTSLLNKGVDVNSFYIDKKTDILVESMVRDNYFIFERALKEGFSLNKNDFKYLHHAIRTNNLDYFNRLLDEYKKINKNINEIDEKSGNNLFHTLFLKKNININSVCVLNDNGIDWHLENKDGFTPILAYLSSVNIISNDFIDLFKKHKNILKLNNGETNQLNYLLLDSEWKQNNKIIMELISNE